MRGAGLIVVLVAGCSTTRRAQPTEPLEDSTTLLLQAEVQDAIVARRKALGVCVVEQRNRAPGSSGKIVVRFNVLPTGETRDVHTSADTPPEMSACLAPVFGGLRFRERAEPVVPVVWPMRF